MAIYTYEVDHGDTEPPVMTGMKLNGGRVVAVAFEPSFEKIERATEAMQNFVDHCDRGEIQSKATYYAQFKEILNS